ncbi:MAG: hypothetical protein ACD_21C00214G0001 [uncultured bacterium]|nr:MAG: hypothetical protein ACD_21C00214G0001 [uncultured bacterium]
MKMLLSHKPFHIIFAALLFCCFTPQSFAAETKQLIEKDVAELKDFVESGLKYLKEKGEKKAYAEFNNPNGRFRTGNLYMFVLGFNGKVLAHGGDPKKMVGTNLFSAKDKFGTPFFQLFVEAVNRGGGIVSYYWPRPDTGLLQYKTSYVAPIDDRAFIGAGVYKSLEVQKSQEAKINELKKFVEAAAEYVKQKGEKEAYKEFSNTKGKFVKGDWYIFVIRYDGLLLAHGGDPEGMVGTSLTDVKDEFGTPLMLLFLNSAKSGGGIVSYYWAHYVEKERNVRFKTSYIHPLGNDVLIGAGYYEEL